MRWRHRKQQLLLQLLCMRALWKPPAVRRWESTELRLPVETIISMPLKCMMCLEV